MRERPPADSMPGEAELGGLGFSGQSPRRGGVGATQRKSLPPLRIAIRHGDLAYARHPVVVGHYLGDSIVAAEKALDQRLGGKLSRQQSLNLYPGAAGTQAIFLQTDARAAPPGAVVVGLGQVGSVSPGELERAMCQAMLAYASQVADCPDDRFGAADATRSARLSCLLVATGAGGVSLRDALDAMLRAALDANLQLQESGQSHRVLIDELEFVELMEDVAIAAARQLERLLAEEPLRSQVEWRHRRIEDGEGGQRRVRFDAADGWWQRMEIAYDARLQAMRFIPVSDRARAEEHVVAGQLRLADQFVRRASQRSSRDTDAARTLFEMLLPNRLKELSPEQHSMVLLVDGVSARYPWELLEDRRSATRRPPAIAAGLLRQLRTPVFRTQPAHPQRATALLVGNPRVQAREFPDLPGAAAEASAVARVLRHHGVAVTDSIGQDADRVLGALHQDGWRVLHLAGHGVHEHALPARDGDATTTRVSGMVIGDGVFLTPGDVAQMREVPELVFLNCCHLGSVAASEGDASDRVALAANLAVQFIEMGVRAVIAAGWAVDDAAARAFAEQFYEQMLSGEGFGEAVRSAREHIWDRFPDANTWGAYQCYGEPGFRLHPPVESGPGATPPGYLAPAELVADLDNLRSRVRMEILDAASQSREGPAAANRVDALLARMPRDEDWTARADVAAALGAVYGEFQDDARAIEWLDRALASDVGDCPIRTLEQRADLGVRQAAARWLALRDRKRAPQHDRAQALELADIIERAIHAIEQLCEHGETIERLCLLGSACKRLAWIRSDRGPRVEALTNMAAYYGRAHRLRAQAGETDTPALLSAVIAELALSWWAPDASLSAAQRRSLGERCGSALAATREKNATDPDFWSGAGESDAALA
ncbi:MAG: CHAT domain-containing protein, partial [Panacagrimonas sp.]